MPFPVEHFLLTVHWKPATYPLETGQFGLRFHVAGVAPAQVIVDGCKPAVQALWLDGTANIASDHLLTFLRLARIAPNGQYKPGTSSFDAVYPTPVGGVGLRAMPAQAAAATTLLTSVPHGQASKGRIFLPPIRTNSNSAGDDLWTLTEVNNRSIAVKTMLNALMVVLGGPVMVMSKGTTRSTGGLGRAVTGVATGRRPDVQRRRAKGIPDPRGTISTLTIPPPGDPGAVVPLG
jgi:hypothetical protein